MPKLQAKVTSSRITAAKVSVFIVMVSLVVIGYLLTVTTNES